MILGRFYVLNVDQIISTNNNNVTLTKVFNEDEEGGAIDAASSNVDGECTSIIKFDKINLNENFKIEIHFSDGSKILDSINLNHKK